MLPGILPAGFSQQLQSRGSLLLADFPVSQRPEPDGVAPMVWSRRELNVWYAELACLREGCVVLKRAEARAYRTMSAGGG